MSISKNAFKEFGRAGGFYRRNVGVVHGEIMNGGTQIRSANSQDYAEKLNESSQDAQALIEKFLLASRSWFSL